MIRHLMCGMALTLLVAFATFAQPRVEPTGAQTASDETAIRGIIQDEIAAWNKGDAVAYSRHFAADGTFTNITGQFFTGYDAFLKQHQVIFEGRFKQTTLQQDIVSLKFVRPDVAVVEVLTAVAGVVSGQLAQGTNAGRRVRILTAGRRRRRRAVDGLDSLARTDGKIGTDRTHRAASGRRHGSAVSTESDRDAGVEPDDRREHQWPFADQSARVGRQATRPLLPVLLPSRR